MTNFEKVTPCPMPVEAQRRSRYRGPVESPKETAKQYPTGAFGSMLERSFQQFLNIAQGSISELDTQIELSSMLSYIDTKIYDDLMEKLTTISKMLFDLSKSLN